MSNNFHPLPFNPPIVESFEDFVEVFNVSFASPTEEANRREIFETNYAAIQAHNLSRSFPLKCISLVSDIWPPTVRADLGPEKDTFLTLS